MVGYYDGSAVSFPLHAHDHLEVNIITRGKGRILLSGRILDLLPGHIVFMYAGDYHQLFERSADFRMTLIDISPRLTRKHGHGLGKIRGTVVLPSHRNSHLLYLCDRLYQFQREWHPDVVNSSLLAIYAFLFSEIRESKRKIPDQLPAVIRKAVDYINSAGRIPGVEEICRICETSQSTLGRRFRRCFGVNYSTWRKQLLVEKFLDSYSRNVTSIEETALSSGFGSVRSFYRIFKEVKGRSPDRFLRSIQDSPRS